MKYLSLDLESTGLEEDAKIIEFACIPVDISTEVLEHSLSLHTFVKCPSFEELKPNLNEFVIKNNKELIEKAHNQGVGLDVFKQKLSEYLSSASIREFFEDQKPVILGKSLSSLDIPLLNRDLGWEYMKEKFHHQTLDVSSIARGMIEAGLLPPECYSSSKLAKHFLSKRDVDHTALEDSIDMAIIYINMNKIMKGIK